MPSRIDVALLRDVSAAVFQNPFSADRHTLDLRIANASGDEDRDALLAKAIARIRKHLTTLGDWPLKSTAFSGEDRPLVERAILFVLFHDFSPPLDEHIDAQLASGRDTVRFDGKLARALRSHGFDRTTAATMTAVMFQMRRAFYFIDRGLTGSAPCMRTFRQQLWTNVMTDDIGRYTDQMLGRMEDFSTILLGETGSGKGAAASAIGRSGYIPYDAKTNAFVDNFATAFVPINLSQFPGPLIESELFGHRKGAFTGAIDRHQGVFSRCSRHGAVFLDEIGDVEVPVQIKLLRVLQDRHFSAVGGHELQRFSGRVIAATNRDLAQLRRDGRFRDDFYYRLCSDVIEVPPLRQRFAEDPDELPRLSAHLVERILGEPNVALADSLSDAVRQGVPDGYGWPGNVRELEQALRRLLLGRPYLGDMDAAQPGPDAALRNGVQAGSLDARTLTALYCRSLYLRHGTYEEVARRTGLDRRTVKKHITS